MSASHFSWQVARGRLEMCADDDPTGRSFVLAKTHALDYLHESYHALGGHKAIKREFDELLRLTELEALIWRLRNARRRAPGPMESTGTTSTNSSSSPRIGRRPGRSPAHGPHRRDRPGAGEGIRRGGQTGSGGGLSRLRPDLRLVRRHNVGNMPESRAPNSTAKPATKTWRLTVTAGWTASAKADPIMIGAGTAFDEPASVRRPPAAVLPVVRHREPFREESPPGEWVEIVPGEHLHGRQHAVGMPLLLGIVPDGLSTEVDQLILGRARARGAYRAIGVSSRRRRVRCPGGIALPSGRPWRCKGRPPPPPGLAGDHVAAPDQAAREPVPEHLTA